MTEQIIYLDHSATTPVSEVVFDEMKPFFSEVYGNPSSLHRQGQRAEAAVEQARALVASIFGCPPTSVFFTSCATESNNLVLKGLAMADRFKNQPYHVLTTPVEHPSVLKPLRQIQDRGQGTYSFFPIDRAGIISNSDFEGLVSDDISLVSVIFGNNEIGSINPIDELGTLLKDRPTLLHTDAVQTANFLDLNVDRLRVDFLSLSAHKFYGPKGVGILYARDPSLIQPLMEGGGQESGLRPGTHNVPLIVGAAKALELAQSDHFSESVRLENLRDQLIDGVLERVPDAELTGHPKDRLPHHASFIFAGINSNELLSALDLRGFECSSGSACKVGNPEPSEVLLAMGYSEVLASSALRVTLGKSSTTAQVDAFISTLAEVLERLRTHEEG